MKTYKTLIFELENGNIEIQPDQIRLKFDEEYEDEHLNLTPEQLKEIGTQILKYVADENLVQKES